MPCDAACLNLGSSFQTDDNRVLKPLLFGDGFSIALKKVSVISRELSRERHFFLYHTL
jgi:hypothetical protein